MDPGRFGLGATCQSQYVNPAGERRQSQHAEANWLVEREYTGVRIPWARGRGSVPGGGGRSTAGWSAVDPCQHSHPVTSRAVAVTWKVTVCQHHGAPGPLGPGARAWHRRLPGVTGTHPSKLQSLEPGVMQPSGGGSPRIRAATLGQSVPRSSKPSTASSRVGRGVVGSVICGPSLM